MARTRVYRGGSLLHDDLSPADAAELIGADDTVVWIDLGPAETGALDGLGRRLGLHPAAVRDALADHPRSPYLHCPNHDFVSARAPRLDREVGTLAAGKVAVLLTAGAIVTVHDAGFAVDEVVERLDAEAELAAYGVGFVLLAVLRIVVGTQYDAVEDLDDALEELADGMFDASPSDVYLQRRSHRLRTSAARLRRWTLPTVDALDALLGTGDALIDPALRPYLTTVRDHAARAAEWTEGLRDTVATIQQTRMALHDSRMGVISKRVSGWAALIAVPTLVTGFYGINVPYPGFGRPWGLVTCCAIMVAVFVALYVLFKRKDWL